MQPELKLLSRLRAFAGGRADADDDAELGAGAPTERPCSCEATFDGDRLVVDAADCADAGRLASSPGCRATVIAALADRPADAVVTTATGVRRVYADAAAGLLVAAGRFAERVRFYDEALARRAERDPLRAASDAVGRAGPVSDIAAETGLAAGARRVDGYDDALAPYVGPTVSRSRVRPRPPTDAVLEDTRELARDGTVRVYAAPDRALRTYHLVPAEATLDRSAFRTLARASERLAAGEVTGGDRAAGRAVRRVADGDDPVELLAAVLRKHTRGYGVLSDFFADPAVSDVFVTAPASENRVRVVADGESMRTNVRLTERGVDALASRFRGASGRAFSRASPTLDAVAEVGDTRVRVAGVTDPVSDGTAFAFRVHDESAWTLPALVANDTLPAAAAAVLSVAVERDAAGLVAGTRGAGKTTLLGALLWEIPAETRTVVIEDTPELPVGALQREGRDVQQLHTAAGGDGGGDSTGSDGLGVAPADALRTALRLGEGALVVGEVRGEEASVLYEAMRVGASGSAVLGTVHGDGGEDVRERMVSDLGVSASSFGVTDLVVTLEPYATPTGRERRVKAIEEVVGSDPVRFEPLYELDGETLEPTGRIDRGTSALVETLTRSNERYADLRASLADRTETFETLVSDGRTSAGAGAGSDTSAGSGAVTDRLVTEERRSRD